MLLAKLPKKTISLNDQALHPPIFSSPKIGGAVEFIQEEPDVERAEDKAADAPDFRDIGGINAVNFSSTESSALESEDEHPLAAPPGWRRFWGRVEWENVGIGEIIFSPFCKHCYDEGLAASCRPRRRIQDKFCTNPHDGPCLYVISYQSHPAEQTSIDNIPEYRMRKLAKERFDTVGTPLEIPTAKTERSIFIRPPPGPRSNTAATIALGHAPTARLPALEDEETALEGCEPFIGPIPTDSQVGGGYGEETTREGQRNVQPKPVPKRKRQPPILFKRRAIPTWVADVTRGSFGNKWLPPQKAALDPSWVILSSYPAPPANTEGLTMESVLGGGNWSRPSGNDSTPTTTREGERLENEWNRQD